MLLISADHRQVLPFAHMCLAALLMLVATPSYADSYSEGMQAYMDKDYELAQAMWMKGAARNDAKSMFNLGFLHEQGLVKSAGLESAENWYKLAGKNGYPAADYHLAQLYKKRNVNPQQERELLQRSAGSGYSPAKRALDNRIEKPTIAAVPLEPATSAARGSDGYRGSDWIAVQSPQAWTIQLLAFEDLTKVQAFIDQHKLHQRSAYYAEPTTSGTLYKLIYGLFGTKQAAADARSTLPDTLKQHKPWLRSVASVQKAMTGR